MTGTDPLGSGRPRVRAMSRHSALVDGSGRRCSESDKFPASGRLRSNSGTTWASSDILATSPARVDPRLRFVSDRLGRPRDFGGRVAPQDRRPAGGLALAARMAGEHALGLLYDPATQL